LEALIGHSGAPFRGVFFIKWQNQAVANGKGAQREQQRERML